MIADIITLLHTNKFLGCGKYTEIAKGKNQIGFEFRKIYRQWRLKK